MSEIKTQLKRVFSLYPSFREYVDRQDDSIATLRAWCRLLESYDEQDLIAVVDLICAGKIEVKSRWSKPDELPWIIAAHCRKMSEDRERFKQTDQLVDASLERRRSSERHKYSITDLYNRVRQSWAMVQRGEKTKEDHEAYVMELRSMARETE